MACMRVAPDRGRGPELGGGRCTGRPGKTSNRAWRGPPTGPGGGLQVDLEGTSDRTWWGRPAGPGGASEWTWRGLPTGRWRGLGVDLEGLPTGRWRGPQPGRGETPDWAWGAPGPGEGDLPDRVQGDLPAGSEETCRPGRGKTDLPSGRGPGPGKTDLPAEDGPGRRAGHRGARGGPAAQLRDPLTSRKAAAVNSSTPTVIACSSASKSPLVQIAHRALAGPAHPEAGHRAGHVLQVPGEVLAAEALLGALHRLHAAPGDHGPAQQLGGLPGR